jgi:hypothetical protein
MLERYLSFRLATISLKAGLDMLHATIASNPFQEDSECLLRTLSNATAEVAPPAGQPDWVQFVALVHQLGGVVPMLDLAMDFDWTVASCSRILVGCVAPRIASFHHCDKEIMGAKEISPQGPIPPSPLWSQAGYHGVGGGPEYMYHMLLHNNHFQIPEEGLLAML